MRAEAAAEREYKDSDVEDESDSVETPKKQHIKKRCTKLMKVKQKILIKRKQELKHQKSKRLLNQYLGGEDVVEEVRYGTRRNYIYKCPNCNIFVKDKLNRHLQLRHKYSVTDCTYKTK